MVPKVGNSHFQQWIDIKIPEDDFSEQNLRQGLQ
jgi:hypothetical protein